MAMLIRLMKDSNRSSSCFISKRLLSAMAACDASDSTSCWSALEKLVTSLLPGSRALSNCRTPITSPSWLHMGTVRKDCER
ncbi:MAG: hypothetical protein ACD_23C00687G0001 [uncultured bacterium]|nr:MAG: hypothetical protein ACD_23C00687G0001 [uncultured bacterium]